MCGPISRNSFRSARCFHSDLPPRSRTLSFCRMPGDVTQLLSAIDSGDPKAGEELLPLVYEELRKVAAAKMAQEKFGHTPQATALVHEAYLRLVDQDQQRWANSRHFFSAAAEAMRRILVERARQKARQKYGGEWQRVN